MNTFVRRSLLIGFITLVGLVAMWPPGEKLKLGIDLSGGTILVYEVKPGVDSTYSMDDLIGALKRRVNPDGVQDIPIRRVGSNRVEIILPKADAGEVEEVKRKMTDVGSLEFRILASRRKDKAAIRQADSSTGLTVPPKGFRWARLGEIVTGKAPKIEANRLIDKSQSWVRNRYSSPTVARLVGKGSDGKDKRVAVTISGNDANSLTLDTTRAILPGNEDDRERPRYTDIGSLTSYFRNVDSYSVDYNPGRLRGGEDLFEKTQARGKDFTERYVLYKVDRQGVNGNDLASVNSTQDDKSQPAVGFHFRPSGGRKFGTLTRENLPDEGGAFQRHLAILLDNQLMSAPVIRAEITDQGIIENMPNREVLRLITILRAGSLPATINPVPLLEEQVGATLGQDTIDKGLRAIEISMLVVPIFMLVYYRFAGLVAVIGLVLNMILLVGSMALVQASFTLPGLAGLALTIGMAVDANVLIFERMREEGEKGASMAQQIRTGFSRAWVTIFDSHVTIVLSGVVLYAIGTEEVKGFALTLVIGILINLFTAVYVGRFIFDYWYSKGWLKKLTMMKMFGHTHIDFVGPRKWFMAASFTIIAAGLVWSYIRWNQMLNIDFTGGTLVAIQLDPNATYESKPLKDLGAPARTELVRKWSQAILADPSVESLRVGKEEGGYRFNIRTTEGAGVKDANAPKGDGETVQDKVRKKFKPILATLEIENISAPDAVVAVAASEPEKDNEKDAVKEKDKEPEKPKVPTSWKYLLTFNRNVDATAIQPKVNEILKAGGIDAPSGMTLERPVMPNGDPATGPKELELKTDLPPDQAKGYFAKIKTALREDPAQLFERVEVFSGAVASDTRTLAVLAIVASWLIIVAYLWYQFKSVTYGLAAVLALVHDVLITLGAVAVSGYKIDLPMIAAFLTLIGFSVNDTIVIFDRIRELKGKTPVLTSKMVNDALNQTLSRTIITSLTAWLVVVILYWFGGEGLQGFSFCLVIGFLSGTYSTVYIATPILVDWMSKDGRKPASRSDVMAEIV